MSKVTSLFKFGSYEIPMTYIAEDGYDCKPNQRQDLDPYTDQTGLTHRNALQHTKTEVSITLRKNLKWDEFESVLQGITSNYANDRERSAKCTYFDTEYRKMSTGTMYLQSSQEFSVGIVNKRNKETTLVFVEN